MVTQVAGSAFISDATIFLRDTISGNVTDPISSDRTNNEKFVHTSYPQREVRYPVVTVQNTDLSMRRLGMGCETAEVSMEYEVRVWGRNVKERDEVAQDVIDSLRDIQVHASGTENALLHSWGVNGATNVSEGGDAGIHSKVITLQYLYIHTDAGNTPSYSPGSPTVIGSITTIQDSTRYVRDQILDNITDPISGTRAGNEKFIYTSYPQRSVRYPIITVQTESSVVTSRNIQSETAQHTLPFEIRIWGRNAKERDHLSQNVINFMRDHQLAASGTVNHLLHDFTVTSAVNVDIPGEAGIKSKAIACNWYYLPADTETAFPVAPVFPSDLVYYWKLNNNGDNEIDPGTNDITPQGTTFDADEKKLGSHSASFDGVNDYLEVDSSVDLLKTGPWTIMMWIRPTLTNNDELMFGGKLGGVPEYQGRYRMTTNGELTTHINKGGSIFRARSGAGFFSANTWYHVALVFDPGVRYHMIVDGVSVHDNTTSIPTNDLNGTQGLNWIFGAIRTASGALDTSGSQTYWKSHMDDIRIYNTAKTAAQVAAIKDAEEPVS